MVLLYVQKELQLVLLLKVDIKKDFSKLYIMCDIKRISTSCFICRQVSDEFFNRGDEIIFYSNDRNKKFYLVKDLCVYPFECSDLK